MERTQNFVEKSQRWNVLALAHCPKWLKPMLESLGAVITENSDALLWHHGKNFREHLQIDIDKILSYAEGNPLRYRTYYYEDGNYHVCGIGCANKNCSNGV